MRKRRTILPIAKSVLMSNTEREAYITRIMQDRLRAAVYSGDPTSDAHTLFIATLLWRARRYFDDTKTAEGDALLELVPYGIVDPFLTWYFDGVGHGPERPLRRGHGTTYSITT